MQYTVYSMRNVLKVGTLTAIAHRCHMLLVLFLEFDVSTSAVNTSAHFPHSHTLGASGSLTGEVLAHQLRAAINYLGFFEVWLVMQQLRYFIRAILRFGRG